MSKDIKWLKSEVGKIAVETSCFYPYHTTINKSDIIHIIDQLNEPEVLSQEWIDENKVARINNLRKMTMDDVVPVDKLQNLLVPKQELPVIPKFVAKWYESEGKRSSWWNWFYKWGIDESRTELEKKTIRWMQDYNEEKFVDMFRYGYEVEEEQKYNVNFKFKSSFGTVGTFLYKEGDEVLAGDNFRVYYPKEEEYMLTEQEIRGFQNGDILFEHFAVKVEELEE